MHQAAPQSEHMANTACYIVPRRASRCKILTLILPVRWAAESVRFQHLNTIKGWIFGCSMSPVSLDLLEEPHGTVKSRNPVPNSPRSPIGPHVPFPLLPPLSPVPPLPLLYLHDMTGLHVSAEIPTAVSL